MITLYQGLQDNLSLQDYLDLQDKLSFGEEERTNKQTNEHMVLVVPIHTLSYIKMLFDETGTLEPDCSTTLSNIFNSLHSFF